MRLIPLLLIVLLAACQGTKSEPDYSTKPKKCDTRTADSGSCVPGSYD